MKRAAIKVGLIFGTLALLGAAGIFAWTKYPWIFQPQYNLKLATGPLASDGQRLLGAFIREVSTEHPIVRIQPIAKESVQASGKALVDGQADLAVVRSDDQAAASGRTVFMLRKIGIGVLLPPNSSVESMTDLVGKKIAILQPADPGDPFMKAFTGFFGIAETDLVRVPLTELGVALKERRVAAAIVLGPIGPGSIGDAFTTLRKSYKGKPTFLDIAEAEAIASQHPVYESVEVKAGAFGGTPPEPPEEINTIAFSLRLVARASLLDRVAGEVTRLMIATRAKLLSTIPAVAEAGPPEAERSATLPVHAGTLAYLNGEQASLLDEALNYVWLIAMILGVIGPAVAYIIGRWRRSDEGRLKLFRLIELARVAKEGTAEELTSAEDDLEGLLQWSFDAMVKGELDRDQFQCVERMIAQVRTSIERRMHSLTPSGSGVAHAAREPATTPPMGAA